MKVKLLRKVRKKIKIYQRNKTYYLIDDGISISESNSLTYILKSYRWSIIKEAKTLFEKHYNLYKKLIK